MRSIAVLILIAISMLFAACGLERSTSFTATVLENDGTLLVRPDDNTPEIKSSDKISVNTTRASIRNSRGEIISLGEIMKGGRVLIRYDGKILESYPAQITADEITLLD